MSFSLFYYSLLVQCVPFFFQEKLLKQSTLGSRVRKTCAEDVLKQKLEGCQALVNFQSHMATFGEIAKNMGRLSVQTHLSSLKFYWHAGFVQRSQTRVLPLRHSVPQRHRDASASVSACFSCPVRTSARYLTTDKAKGRETRKLITWEFIQTEPRSMGHATIKNHCMRIPLIWTCWIYGDIFDLSIINFNYKWAFLHHEQMLRKSKQLFQKDK